MKCECSLNNNFQIIGLCDLEKFNEQILKFKERSYSQLSLPEQITVPNNFPSIESIIKTYINLDIYSSKIVDSPTSNLSNIEGFNLTGKMLLVSGSLEQIIVYTQKENCKTRHSLKVNSHFSSYIVLDGKIEKNKTTFSVYPYIEDLSLISINNRVISRNISLFLFVHDTKINPLPPPPAIEKLLNTFIFRTSDTNNEMAKIEFDKTNKKLIVTSTDDFYNRGEAVVFTFELKNSTQTQVKAGSSIRGNENAINFKNSLNNTKFEYGDLIELSFANYMKVILTNHPQFGDTYNMLTSFSQSFKITQNGIIPYILPNNIILNNKDNNPIVIMQFDILTQAILIKSTANETDRGSQNYFNFTLYETDGKTQKIIASIPGESDASNFENQLFGEIFDYGDVIKLGYEEREKVIITNFPNSSTSRYNPKGNEEYFQITENGLISFTPPSPPPVIEKLPNAFIFKTSDTNKEMAKVEFNKTNNKLIVTSTGDIYNDGTGSAFRFELANLTFTQIKADGLIRGNENATNFKNNLNNVIFQYGDLIYLRFLDYTKVTLTNSPSIGDTYSMLTAGGQSFIITPVGIVPYTLNNSINLNDTNDDLIITIKFDILSERFLIRTTGNSTESGSQNYFKLTLYERDAKTEKITGFIPGDSDASDFKNKFFGKNFEFQDVIKLEYEKREKVVITNFPNPSTSKYNPRGNEEYFQITENGLISFTPPSPPPPDPRKLSNEFIFSSVDDDEISKVGFDISNMNLIVTSTSVPYGETTGNPAFRFELLTSDVRPLKSSSINDNENADNFKGELNSEKFEFGNLINLFFVDPSKVVLSNYPMVRNIYNMLTFGSQSFIITPNGIIPYILNNSISLNDEDDDPVIRIEFDVLNKRFLIKTTGYETNPGGQNYFKLTLYRSDGITIKKTAFIPGEDDGSNFENEFFGQKFDYDDIIKLEYEDRTKVVITNFPNQGTPKYNPRNNMEQFQIKEARLIAYSQVPSIRKLPNDIIIKAADGREIAKIQFDTSNRKLISITTGVIDNTKASDVNMVTLNLDNNRVIATLKFSTSPNQFAQQLNDVPFDYNDNIIILYNNQPNHINVTNYPKQGDTFIPSADKLLVSFRITQLGLD